MADADPSLIEVVPPEPVVAGNFSDVTDPERDSTEVESTTTQLADNPDDSPTLAGPTTEVDLDAIEKDLTGVEVALSRLAEGTYWTDEVTGTPLPEQVLAADPTARRS